MEIRELKAGEAAPEGSDRITLLIRADGRFNYEAVHTTGTVTHHSTFQHSFDTKAEALRETRTGAERSGIVALYVETAKS